MFRFAPVSQPFLGRIPADVVNSNNQPPSLEDVCQKVVQTIPRHQRLRGSPREVPADAAAPAAAAPAAPAAKAAAAPAASAEEAAP